MAARLADPRGALLPAGLRQHRYHGDGAAGRWTGSPRHLTAPAHHRLRLARSRRAARRPGAGFLFLLLLFFETYALPAGGEVAITRTTDRIEVVARGPRIAANGPLWQALGTSEPAIEAGPSEVQFLLAPEAARGLSRRIGLELGAERLVLSA
ncbi:MAG: histidine phosphotransferase family protein [Paracoccaceae bacterium]